MDSIEKDIIKRVYIKNKKNISRSAEELMISRQNLQYKLRKHDLI